MNRNLILILISCLVFCLPLFVAAPALAQDADSIALDQLQAFLMDPAARSAFASGSPQAAQASQFLEKFPPWARQELLEIVMDIMREEKSGASRHVQSYKSQGAESAYGGFSPAVKARIDALTRKLQADPAFSSGQNLENMKPFAPVIE